MTESLPWKYEVPGAERQFEWFVPRVQLPCGYTGHAIDAPHRELELKLGFEFGS
jgi:hypothetical protein